MNKEMDFDFDNVDMIYKNVYDVAIYLYAKGEYGEKGELIQRLVVKNLGDIQIDYVNKKFSAQYIGKGINGIKTGEKLDIDFYEMVIV